jgi:protein-arginine kinase activator protein McsA
MRDELKRLMDELTEQPEHHGACPRCHTRYSDWFTTNRDGVNRYCFTCYHAIRFLITYATRRSFQ